PWLDHGQRNPSRGLVHLENPDAYHVTDCNHVVWILDITIGHLTDVNQAAVLQANVDEGTEGNDVQHRTLEFHAGLQILEFQDTLLEDRGRLILSRVPARSSQSLGHVSQARDTYVESRSEIFERKALELVAQHTFPGRILQHFRATAKFGQELACEGIALGVN